MPTPTFTGSIGVVTDNPDQSRVVATLRSIRSVVVTTYPSDATAQLAPYQHSLVVIESYGCTLSPVTVMRNYLCICQRRNLVPATIVVALHANVSRDEAYCHELRRAGAAATMAVPMSTDGLCDFLLAVAAWGPRPRAERLTYAGMEVQLGNPALYVNGNLVTSDPTFCLAAVLLVRNRDQYVTTYEALANHLQCSLRQVKARMLALRRLLENHDSPIHQIQGRGYVIRAVARTTESQRVSSR